MMHVCIYTKMDAGSPEHQSHQRFHLKWALIKINYTQAHVPFTSAPPPPPFPTASKRLTAFSSLSAIAFNLSAISLLGGHKRLGERKILLPLKALLHKLSTLQE